MARANYQAKIWLQADQEHIDVSSPVNTSAWEKESGSLKAVWTRLPPIPEARLELVACGCQTKCRTPRCICCKKDLTCTTACGCDMVDCCNLGGQYRLNADKYRSSSLSMVSSTWHTDAEHITHACTLNCNVKSMPV